MTQTGTLGNEIRPLRNVAALATLIERVEGRQTYLPGMACFYGPSGYGKTFSAVYAAREFSAVHVECRDFWTRKGLAEAIAAAFGVRPERTLPKIFDQLVEQLTRSGRPLIIDEADHLIKQAKIELVRALHDSTGATVILVGEHTLPHNLKAIERVHGRMFDWVEAQPADIDDARHLVPMYGRGIGIAEDLLAAIHRESRGSIRRVSVNLGRAAEIALTLGRKDMDLKSWGVEPFFTGEPPAIGGRGR